MVKSPKMFQRCWSARLFGGQSPEHPSPQSRDVMIMPVLHGPHCPGTDRIRHGTTRQGPQRSRCQDNASTGRTVLLDDTDAGHAAGGQQPRLARAMHASGLRETARGLHGRPTPRQHSTEKKEPAWPPVPQAGRRGRRSALDARGSVVPAQATPRWRWPAMAPHTGQGCAYGCGRRQDSVCVRRHALLEPCGLTQYAPDGWGADARQRAAAPQHRGAGAHPAKRAHAHQSTAPPQAVRASLRWALPRRHSGTLWCLASACIGRSLDEPSERSNTCETPSPRFIPSYSTTAMASISIR